VQPRPVRYLTVEQVLAYSLKLLTTFMPPRDHDLHCTRENFETAPSRVHWHSARNAVRALLCFASNKANKDLNNRDRLMTCQCPNCEDYITWRGAD
jgi:hypothetical protein